MLQDEKLMKNKAPLSVLFFWLRDSFDEGKGKNSSFRRRAARCLVIPSNKMFARLRLLFLKLLGASWLGEGGLGSVWLCPLLRHTADGWGVPRPEKIGLMDALAGTGINLSPLEWAGTLEPHVDGLRWMSSELLATQRSWTVLGQFTHLSKAKSGYVGQNFLKKLYIVVFPLRDLWNTQPGIERPLPKSYPLQPVSHLHTHKPQQAQAKWHTIPRLRSVAYWWNASM